MLDFLSEDVRRNPFPFYTQLRSVSPLVHDPRSGLFLVFDYDGVKRALTDSTTFSSNPGTANHPAPRWLIFEDAPRHTSLRALIMKAFTPASVTLLEPRIRELCTELVDSALEHGEADLASGLAVPLPMRVIAEMVGVPAEDWKLFRRWSDSILKLSYSMFDDVETAAAGKEYMAVSAEMSTYLAELTAARKAKRAEDLLTRLTEAEVDGERLTPDEILAFVQLLLVAGHETTTNLINNAVICLTDAPDEMARLRVTPSLLPTAIEEALRYRSPVQWIYRTTRQAVEMHGQTIPAGRFLLPVIGSANRDQKWFPQPDRFDVGRDPNHHLAFGHGIHFCLGAPLARLEGRIALGELISRTKSIEYAGSGPWQPRKALHVHGPARLPVRLVQN